MPSPPQPVGELDGVEVEEPTELYGAPLPGAPNDACANGLRAFEAAHVRITGSGHAHVYALDASTKTPKVKDLPGLLPSWATDWGVAFGHWSDGECGYHAEAYLVHFERVGPATAHLEEGWTDLPGERRLSIAIEAAFLSEPVEEPPPAHVFRRGNRLAWLVDWTQVWTISDPDADTLASLKTAIERDCAR